MGLKDIKAGRSIFSYSKVHLFVSGIIRGKRIFIDKKRINGKTLINVGCGPFPAEDFINLDYYWNPSIDICWNISGKKYPLSDNSYEGIFTEHCLEHISFDDCLFNLKEFYRLLKPGGVVRIVVPDGELYCDLYQLRKHDKNVKMPYGDAEETGMISINRIFRGHGHKFIYDFETFRLLLLKAGFTKVQKRSFMQGSDSRLLIDRKERAPESLYIEAVK